jgi:hypothetical protein
MKRKDMIYLIATVAIVLVAGYVGYTQLLAPKKTAASGTSMVDVIGVIPSSFDQMSVDSLNDSSKTQDFVPAIDLSTGLGTSAPFGQ